MSGSETASKTGRVVLAAATPGVGFTIVDGTFQTVARGVGRLEAELPHGIYEIAIRTGSSVETQLVSLQPGQTWERLDITPGVYAAAPLAGSRTATATHTAAVETASRAVADGTGPATAGLVLVVRRTAGETVLHHEQLHLLDRSLDPVQGWPAQWVVDEQAGVATIGGRLDPGPYVLRLARPRGPALDQTVWLSDGWQTLVFCPNGADGADLDDAVVHLTRLDQPFPGPHPEIAAAVEIAVSGLRQGLPLVNDDLLDVLRDSGFADPMLGIAGAHALLLRDRPDARAITRVVAELRKLLPDHPDVLALARHPICAMTDVPSVWWPPMLAASYQKALLAADQRDPAAILDGSPAERVAGYVVQRGLWLCWEATPAVLSPDPTPEDTALTTAMTDGAKRRIERHVGEVAELTGDDRHKVAGALGVHELARRLQLPVQAVQAVLEARGWNTVLIDGIRTVIDDDVTEEAIDRIPAGSSPFAGPRDPNEPPPGLLPDTPPTDPASAVAQQPTTQQPVVAGQVPIDIPVKGSTRGRGRSRSWLLLLAGVLTAVLLVAAGARYFSDRGLGEVALTLADQPGFFDRTAVRTQDLTLTLKNNENPQAVTARVDGSGYVADAKACARVIAGRTCLVRVTFGPPTNQTQPMLATLVLSTPGTGELRIPLYGTSRAPEGDISVDWTGVEPARIGQTIRPTVVIDNIPPDAVHTVVTVTVPPGFDIGTFDAKDKCDARRRTVLYCWVGLDSHHEYWRIRIPLIGREGSGGTLKADAQLSRNPDLLDNDPGDNTAETTVTLAGN